MIGPSGKPAGTGETTATGGAARGLQRVRPARVPGGAARRQTPGDPAHERHDLAPGCTPAQVKRLHLRQLVSARHRARKDAVRRRQIDLPAPGNRTEPVRRRLQTARGLKAEGGARQPGHRARAGPPGGIGRRQGHASRARTAGTCSTTNRCSNGADITNPQQSFDEGAGGTGRAERDVRLHLPRAGRLPTRHQGNRPSRPGSPAAGREPRSGAAALRDRARRPADHGAVDRLHAVPGRDRRLHRLADLRRVHAHLRAGTRQRAAVRARCRSAGTDLQLAGLGDARQNGARTRASSRALIGLRGRVPVPAAVLPRARARSPIGGLVVYGIYFRADQADPDHADAARDRRADPDDRRRARTRTS